MRNLIGYWPYWGVISYLALLVGAVWLWIRTRSVGPAVMTVGFALTLPNQIWNVAEFIATDSHLRGAHETTDFLLRHHLSLHLMAQSGLGLASIGLLIHAFQQRRA